MRNLIIITVLSLSTISGYCYANDFFKDLNDSFSKVSTLLEFETRLNDKYENFRISKINNILNNRNLDFQFKQSIYQIEIRFDKSRFEKYRVFIITKNDSIVLGKLEKFYSKQQSYFSTNLDEIKKYIEFHNSKYKTNLNEKDFKNQLSELLVFSLGCGIDGKNFSKEHFKMMKFVEKKNYKKLSEWLCQINPEIQAYGIEGLYRLQKTGIKIKPSDMELIESFKSRSIVIYGCSGCITGDYILIDEIIERI